MLLHSLAACALLPCIVHAQPGRLAVIRLQRVFMPDIGRQCAKTGDAQLDHDPAAGRAADRADLEAGHARGCHLAQGERRVQGRCRGGVRQRCAHAAAAAADRRTGRPDALADSQLGLRRCRCAPLSLPPTEQPCRYGTGEAACLLPHSSVRVTATCRHAGCQEIGGMRAWPVACQRCECNHLSGMFHCFSQAQTRRARRPSPSTWAAAASARLRSPARRTVWGTACRRWRTRAWAATALRTCWRDPVRAHKKSLASALLGCCACTNAAPVMAMGAPHHALSLPSLTPVYQMIFPRKGAPCCAQRHGHEPEVLGTVGQTQDRLGHGCCCRLAPRAAAAPAHLLRGARQPARCSARAHQQPRCARAAAPP